MTVFSITSLLVAGHTLDTSFFIWSVFDRFCISGDEGTIDTCFKILAWSFFWLYMGEWPRVDWKGHRQPTWVYSHIAQDCLKETFSLILVEVWWKFSGSCVEVLGKFWGSSLQV